MTNTAVVHRYFECLNTEDWAGLRELWHPDAELQAVGARPRRGVDDIIGFFSGLFAPWAEHRDTPTRLIVDGDALAADVRFDGVTPDGHAVTFFAVDVFDFAEGRLLRLTNWYDLAHVRRALATVAAPSG
jgi:ketosteroid isomerase-like protein